MSARAHPQVILVSIEELRAGLDEVRGIIRPAGHQKFAQAIESLRYLQELLAAKDSTLRKLRQLIFGEESERLEKVFPKDATPGDTTSGAGAASEQTTAPESPSKEKTEKPKGHGRNGASDYAGAERIKVPHPALTFGCACPHCQKGKV